MQMPAAGTWLAERELDDKREVEVRFDDVHLWRFSPGADPRCVLGVLMAGIAIVDPKAKIIAIGFDGEHGKPRDWLPPGSEMFQAVAASIKHQRPEDISDAVWSFYETDDDPHREHRLTARELI